MVRENALWRSMYQRCYSEKGYTSYYDVTISPNFRDYSYFYEWCHRQTGFDQKHENGRYWNLDKDLICIGNRRYHEDFCAFLPTEVNNVLNTPNNKGNGVVGVRVVGNNYVVSIKEKEEHPRLLTFKRREAAYCVYKESRENRLRYLAEKWEGLINNRVVNTLRTHTLPTYDILYGEDVL